MECPFLLRLIQVKLKSPPLQVGLDLLLCFNKGLRSHNYSL